MNVAVRGRRFHRIAALAASLVFPWAAQAGNPQVDVSVENLTNNLVSYSSAAIDLQIAYAAFHVTVKNNTSASTTSYFRMQSLSSGQTSTIGYYPTFVASDLPAGCQFDATVPPASSAVLCTWDLAPGEIRDFRVRVQTPQAPVGFSGTDYLFAKYSLQAGQGGANGSNLVYSFSDKSTLVVQTSREIHSFVEGGQDLFVYVDQGRTDVQPPRPVLVGLNQSVNKQSCSPQVKRCLISTVTIVNTSNNTEQFYDPTWPASNPDGTAFPGWLKIALIRDASTINKRANIDNATVRYSKDGVNYIDVYDCSALSPPMPQTFLPVPGATASQIGPNTHCIHDRQTDSQGRWILNIIASENGKIGW
ncbi:MAG TPA: hypothetical protein VLD35_07255 [Caldimonas sp.]|nr:hypothetical protein [Caldimonas sp.]